jgi:YD repeat-containing protein
VPGTQLPSTSNYFLTNDPNTWYRDVPNYAEVTYPSVYPGVDLTYHASPSGQLEFDFTVAPGADPSAIRLGWQGVSSQSVDQQGNLVLQTASGPISLLAPATYQTSADGQQTLQFRYNGSSQLTGMTAIDGALSTFTYVSGLLSTIATAGGRTYTFAYSGTNLTQVTDPDGGVHTFAYDGSHHVTGDTFGGLQDGWAYTSAGTLGTMTWGSATGPGGATNLSQTAYTPAVLDGLNALLASGLLGGAPASQKNPDGHTTYLQLDGSGRPLQGLVPDGGPYDAVGNLTSSTDPLGHSSSTQYDKLDRATVQTDALGHGITITYDADGDVSTVTDPLGTVTSYGYDANDRQTMTTDAAGTSVQRTGTVAYDNAGNVTSQTDGLGHTVGYSFDKLNRQPSASSTLVIVWLSGSVTATWRSSWSKP